MFQLLDWHNFWLDQTIGMKVRSIDVCLKTLQIYGKWKTAIWAQLCKLSFSTIIHPGYFILKQHLLRKAQNSLCPLFILYSRVDFCSCVCWSWHFSPDKSRSRLSTFLSNLSVSDRKLRISLKPVSLRSPKSAAISTVRFWWAIFSQNDAKSSISWPSSTPTAFAS